MFNKRIIQHFMKNAPVGLALVNSKNKVVFTNSYLHEHTGFQAKELQGEDFFDKFFPDQESKDFIRRKISTSTERPFEDFQIDIQKKSGKIISASLSCSAFALGSKILVACVIQDMTGRNLYEKVIEAGYDNLQQVTIDLETAMKKITEQQNILKAYKARMTRELEIATSVQHAIIPTEFPTNKKIDIWGKSVSSEKLGAKASRTAAFTAAL